VRIVPVGRWPHVISGTGILLTLSLFAESVVFLTTSVMEYSAFVSGAVTSLPFAVGVAYGGYWLARSELPPDRYGQVGRWWIAGIVGTVVLVLIINIRIQPVSALLIVGTVRWSAAIGGGVGLLVGILQAMAVMWGMEAERARRRRRETERERESLEAFAEILSHELQNPLHVAQGHLELLREERDSPHIDTIAEAQRRMSEVVEDTLKLAHVNDAIDDTDPVELSAVAGVAWEAVEPTDATLEVTETRTLRADRDRLRDLLCELFRNSVEHGSTGSRSDPHGNSVEHGSTGSRTKSDDATEHVGSAVTVEIGVLEDGTGFYVADDGPGIPESDREKVFTPGYAGPGENIGLGLGFVRRIAESHGWDVAVTESETGGARFEFRNIELRE
jgi:signal transduction histidine kinase